MIKTAKRAIKGDDTLRYMCMIYMSLQFYPRNVEKQYNQVTSSTIIVIKV